MTEVHSANGGKQRETTQDALEKAVSEREIDIQALRRTSDRIPLASWIIIFIEFCERFAFRGGVITFINYVRFPPNLKNQAGALGKGQTTAYALKQVFAFMCYIWPLFLGILCDQYWGKYRTIMFCCFVFGIGWTLLTLTSIPPSLEAGVGFPGYIISIIIIACGSGGIKSFVQPMAADQFQQDTMKIKEVKGELVVIDPEINARQVYHWFMGVMQLGSLVGGVISPQIEHRVGFWVCYLFPAVLTIASTSMFFICRNRYHKVPPSGDSAVVKLYKCFKYGYGRYKHSVPKPESILDCSKDNGPLGVPPESMADREAKTWDDEFVENAKETLRACKILIPTTLWALGSNQVTSSLVSQASSMSRPTGIPNDIMFNFNSFFVIVLVPILMYIVYPYLERHNIEFRPMKRMVVGFILGALAMMSSAIAQNEIVKHSKQGLPQISVWWQLPTYFLMALSEILVMVTPLEYCYTRTPQSMKGLVSALSLLPQAVATAIDLALSSVSQEVWMYGSFAILNAVTGVLFWYFYGHYDKIDEELAQSRMNIACTNEKN
ncbi:PTR2-domain-containing protein, partial [Basidiobolus meristosporus CBS 931.73]